MEAKQLKELKGSSIYKMELLDGLEMVKETLTLEDLTKRKKQYADKLNSLHSSLSGTQNLKLDTLIDLHSRITALQYNLLFIKLRMTTLNIGIPEKGYHGIYASIFQSSDLNTTLSCFVRLSNGMVHNYRKTEDQEKVTKYLDEQVNTYKKLITNHRKVQADYNKTIKVEIELYKID